MSWSEPPLGILGGTFDPVHFGHLRLAEEARSALGLARVRLIPAGQPAHRDAPATSGHHRLAMTRLAVAGAPGLEVDDIEMRSSAPSYTVPTLERLRAEVGEQLPLVLIMGVDAFLGLHRWYRWHDLFLLAHIAVGTRPGYSLEAVQPNAELAGQLSTRRAEAAELARAPAGRIVSFAMTPLAISATAIRHVLAHGGSARFLLPEVVLDYIDQHHLYGS